MLWDIESDISDSPGVIVEFSNYLRTYSLPFYCTASLWSQCGDLTYSYCLIPGITHGELKWRQPPLPEMLLSFCLFIFFILMFCLRSLRWKTLLQRGVGGLCLVRLDSADCRGHHGSRCSLCLTCCRLSSGLQQYWQLAELHVCACGCFDDLIKLRFLFWLGWFAN